MKKSRIKKLTCAFLALIVVCAASFTNPGPASAADDYVNIMHKVSTATANSPINYNFSLSKSSDIYFIVRTNERTGATISVKDPVHDIPVATINLAVTNPNWQYNQSSGIYQNTAGLKLEKGDYILELRFENDINYDLSMNQLTEMAKLNKTKTTITKGFTETLKVNGGIIKSCSSSNKSIATVNNKGKITAKKNGAATIKVNLTNGKTLSCKVTVVSNKYSAKKITVNSSSYNTIDMKAYEAHFDSKGNLVVKFKIVNNSYGQITSIPKFKITVKDSGKNTVASYSKSVYKVTVPSYKDKSCTVTIPKSSLKKSQSKTDLRTSKISVTAEFANASF